MNHFVSLTVRARAANSSDLSPSAYKNLSLSDCLNLIFNVYAMLLNNVATALRYQTIALGIVLPTIF